MKPLLVLADFVFDEEGEGEFLRHRDRCLAEVRAVEGCLQALLWTRPGRRYRFSTLWTDREAVSRRWTRELPGWDEARPARCARCDAPFPGIDP